MEARYKVITTIIKLLLIFIIFVVTIINIVSVETNSMLIKNEFKVSEEKSFYKEIIKKEIDIEKCKTPYIFDGFSHVEGTWDTGFVIQDENGNQYVWVPCTNKNNSYNIEILKKTNFLAIINKNECYESNYKEFLESSLKNGGFYISRFEIGKDENGNPVSKINSTVWTDITRDEAEKVAKNMYKNINSELINGYAYDTVYSWIINNEEVEAIHRKLDDIYTGTQSYKNIYDIVDDIYELTGENFYEQIVYRGIINNDEIENILLDNRYCAGMNYKSKNLGFRAILYK